MRSEAPRKEFSDLYITGELDRRPATASDYRQEMLAIQDLAVRMAERPEDVLPRFVDLALEITGGVSAGISLFEPEPPPGVFRWRFLRGSLAQFEGAETPGDFSPCGVTLGVNGPVLARHPERAYDWIGAAGLAVPEVLLVPVYVRGAAPHGTLWIVADQEGHFNRSHARAITELATMVGIALRMLQTEQDLHTALTEQARLAEEMSHRVKNVFTIVDAMVRLSRAAATDKDALADAISGRLHALARAHSLVRRKLRLVGRPAPTGDLRALVDAVLAPHQWGTPQAGRARILRRGPRLVCGEQAFNALALVLHELATNAAKYGALSRPEGAVEVTWSVVGGDLRLTWRERGGPQLAGRPDRSGFGATLIRSTVAQLHGAVDMTWDDPAGLQVTIRVPLANVRITELQAPRAVGGSAWQGDERVAH
jgi:two-component sensor histidine kinase